MKMIKSVGLGLLLATMHCVSAEASVRTGKLFDLETSKKFLYSFENKSTNKGELTEALVTYRYPDGKVAVQEKSVRKDDKILNYVFEQKQIGAKGKLEIKDGRAFFTWEKGGKTKTDDEKVVKNFVAAPTLVTYLQNNWKTIAKGDSVDVRFAVLDRLETVGFSYFKVEEKKKDGQDVVVVKMKPSSFIIAAIVDPLYFTFKADGSELLEVRGRTQVKQKKGDDWADLDVHTIYGLK